MPASRRTLRALLATALLATGVTEAKPPTLYANPSYQSPVHGDAGELLLLPGSGFGKDDTVWLDGTTALGVVSRSPYALTVKLPADLDGNRVYSLDVRNQAGERSERVRINDPRPLWITPSRVSASTDTAGLQRRLKIAGRNLQGTRLRLTGPAEMSLPPLGAESDAISRHALTVQLPSRLTPGAYRVSVSRDGKTWVALSDQQLIVEEDTPAPRIFPVEGCKPDDAVDDTACIVAAIAKAAGAGGGAVRFTRGTWNLDRRDVPGVDATEGIYLPQGVALEGDGARVVRGGAWKTDSGIPVFTLLGRNTIRGFTFVDARVYTAKDPPNPFLRLGKIYYRADKQAFVADVVITGNEFHRAHTAIADAGLPLRRLFITHNLFGAFHDAIFLSGNRYNTANKFRIDDSVISHNTFLPGSYLDVANGQGTIATQIGASQRLDFSHNTADGAATTQLYSPQDARGWRAAFFWHMNGSQEQLLISGNMATCTGDKVGDGESFSFDGNANTTAFDKVRTVLGATATSLTVTGLLERRQHDREVDVASYYVGHWVRVAEGAGLGQARRITGYRVDAGSGRVTFEVVPAWDVVPEKDTSRVSVGREYWQMFVVGNTVDHRVPLCQKSNRGKPKGGGILVWGPTVDSVVEGNRQYDTDGITIQHYYNAVETGCKECFSAVALQSMLEVRNNVIEGEYDWTSACSVSGIVGSYAVAPTPGSPPPLLSFGLSISGNAIDHADGYTGGAIVFPLTWYEGPPPHRWRLIENALIQNNRIRNITGAPSRAACRYEAADRMGIQLRGKGAVSRAVLHGNTCENVKRPLVDLGVQTVRVCSDARRPSCECDDR